MIDRTGQSKENEHPRRGLLGPCVIAALRAALPGGVYHRAGCQANNLHFFIIHFSFDFQRRKHAVDERAEKRRERRSS